MNLLLSDVKRIEVGFNIKAFIFFYSVFYLYTLILLREKWGEILQPQEGPGACLAPG